LAENRHGLLMAVAGSEASGTAETSAALAMLDTSRGLSQVRPWPRAAVEARLPMRERQSSLGYRISQRRRKNVVAKRLKKASAG
jgi:hypothetical protein